MNSTLPSPVLSSEGQGHVDALADLPTVSLTRTNGFNIHCLTNQGNGHRQPTTSTRFCLYRNFTINVMYAAIITSRSGYAGYNL
jgi:hypothetical protein